MASSRPWPCDDDDRPSGSVRPLSQADLRAILAHLGDDPDQLLASSSEGVPVAAVRVRASVGRPGGSAQARWRRERAAEGAAWTRSLPWRVAAILGVGAVGGGIPHRYLTFQGEGHGLRRPSSIRRALEAELSLYLDAMPHAPSTGHLPSRGANRTRPA
jgi:hypothetical protein